MSPKGPFSIKKRVQSFSHAVNGLKQVWKSEHNFRIHLVLFLISLFLGFYFKITRWEWGLYVLASGLVIMSELFNTALEWVCDYTSPKIDPRIKRIKDVAAAAVLVSAICAAIIGLIIFVPYLF